MYTLFVVIVAFSIGAIIAAIEDTAKMKKFMEPFDAAIAKCEMNLPRNQTCVLEYIAKVKP